MLSEKLFATDKGNIRYWTNEMISNQKTLVFLPGLTADHRLFDKQLEYFENKYHVLVWDAPGHAASTPFELSFSLDDKVHWLHDILTKENIDKPIFVGQSMGGYVSQCFMEWYPRSLTGFVSIDSAPLKKVYMTAAEIWLLKHMESVYRWYPWKSLIRSGSKGCSTTSYGQKLMQTMMSEYTHLPFAALAGHGYRILADAIIADKPYLIDCPCLLICGEQDKAGSTKRYNRRWAEREKLPIVWIPNAGHNANTDCPDIVNNAIEDFVNTLSY